jgi:2-oxoglutarate ferredoxin oxidoreductase subunit beta
LNVKHQIPEAPAGMGVVYQRPAALTEKDTHYCPGCTHGIIHRLVAEVLDELEISERAIGVAPVGCSVLAYNYFDVDFAEAAHGRAPAMATGIKRTNPDNIVFTYQGDGDLASIGLAEIVHAANRGELLTIIFVNNAIYGMTGGQMAPTSLPGQVTKSSPTGRDVELAGFPMRMAELLGGLPGVAYVTRSHVTDIGGIRKTKKAIKMAFRAQMEELGLSMVEILSTCYTNWGLTVSDAMKWVREFMIPYYPLGETCISETMKDWR